MVHILHILSRVILEDLDSLGFSVPHTEPVPVAHTASLRSPLFQ